MSYLQESQPLLFPNNRVYDDAWISHYTSAEVEDLLGNGEKQLVTVKWWSRVVAWEAKLIWLLSWPAAIYGVFNYMLTFITLIFVGHLGDSQFAGASLACLGLQGLSYGLMVGMATAVQTLCGQAYGAKKYAVMGIICQRSIILQLVAAILLTPPFWYCGPLLSFIGRFESNAILEYGQVFGRGSAPQLYAYALYFPMQGFLVAQNRVNVMACTSVGVFLLHVLVTWLVVSFLGFGLLGAALTLSFSWWVNVLVTGLYIILSPSCTETWTGFSIKAFKLKGLWPYFMLTISSAAMLCSDVWYPLVVNLISQMLANSTTLVDSLSICLNYMNWYSTFAGGMLVASSVRVGNELGARNPRVAKLSVAVCNGISVLTSFTISVIFLIFRVGLIKLYATDSDITEVTSSLFPLVALYFVILGYHFVLVGQAIGSGRQTLVAWVNVASYYLIGLPLSYVLNFKTSLGVAGLFWGLIIGLVLQTATVGTILFQTNWDAEVEKVAALLKNSADEEILKDLADDC
ncbi:protein DETOXIFICATION 41-like [Neltuma alba]|uniref:protein DETOXIFICATION 41-like n=1 Tax=Neltuma alba TaxID=207710 RepID=UPI0010A4C3BD|nr:protein DETOXIFICATION 41-like [Prosopis alba]